MKIEQDLLIENLLELSYEALDSVRQFKGLSDENLNFKPDDVTWSILECIAHLNLYGKFYLPEIERQLLKSKSIKGKRVYKSSVLGDYFVKTVKASNTKKIKSTKAMDSTGLKLKISVIDQFIKQLELFILLLNKCKSVDLNKVKTAISLTRFVKLRLGDTLRFLVYHNDRHVNQANQIKIKFSS